MKKVLAAVLAAYIFQSSDAQIPPLPPQPNPNPPQPTIPIITPPVVTPPAAPIVTPPAAPIVTPPIVTPATPVTTAQAVPIVTPPGPVLTPAPIQPIIVPQPPVLPVITPAPVTTAAPIITPAPVTAAPTTAAPTMNPYCPPATALTKIGSMQVSAYPISQNAACKTTTGALSIARDYQGQLTCGSYHCCLCSEINCGGSGFPCENLKISDSGAVGVQNIVAIGGSTGFWGMYGWQNGAQVDCAGLESCKAARVLGQYVGQMQCTGDMACESANILLEPSEQMNVQCNGMMSCMNANIEIIIGPNTMITELGTIEFNGAQSAMGATITIRNLGANPVILHNLECMNPTACPNTQFIIEGNIMIENCDLQGLQNLNILPPIIQQCALGNAGLVNPWNTFPVPAPPVYPSYPIPAPQTVPSLPSLPSLPVPAPLTPSVPAPITPSVPAPAPGVVTPAPVAASGIAVTPGILPVNAIQQLQCGSAAICNHKSFTISPTENWKLDCSLANACAGMQLTLNIGLDPLNNYEPVTHIDSLKFVKPYAGMGATITLNTLSGGFVELNDIRCEAVGSCSGLTIVADAGIDVANMNMDCQEPTSCIDCKVIQGVTTYDCMQLHAMGGNMNVWGGQQGTWNYPAIPAPAVPAPPTNPTWTQGGANPNWQQQQLMWQYYGQYI